MLKALADTSSPRSDNPKYQNESEEVSCLRARTANDRLVTSVKITNRKRKCSWSVYKLTSVHGPLTVKTTTRITSDLVSTSDLVPTSDLVLTSDLVPTSDLVSTSDLVPPGLILPS